MKVSLFITCISDALFPPIGEAMTQLLARYGVRLDFPKVQTCCGQLGLQQRLLGRSKSFGQNDFGSV